jgi:hypothetical protein
MARSLRLSKVLVFGPSDVRILAEFTAEALLKPPFRQFRKEFYEVVPARPLRHGCGECAQSLPMAS